MPSVGTFRVSIEVGDSAGERWETLEALVDTGASHSVVPRPLLERLGVTPEERWPFRLADERQVEYDVGQTQVRIDGRTRFTIVVFGDAGSLPLLGAYTLEGFRLAPDPVGRRLIPVPGLLM
jgi:clan AA aspartic protease